MLNEYEEAASTVSKGFDSTTLGGIGALIAAVFMAIGAFLPKLSSYLSSRGDQVRKAREVKERRDWSNQTIMLDRLQDEFNELKDEVKTLRMENLSLRTESLECEKTAAVLEEKIKTQNVITDQQRETIKNQGQEIMDLRAHIKHLET